MKKIIIENFCDKCGKEIKEQYEHWMISYLKEEKKDKLYEIEIKACFGNEFMSFTSFNIQLCPKCNKDFSKKLKDLINKELLENKVQLWHLNGA